MTHRLLHRVAGWSLGLLLLFPGLGVAGPSSLQPPDRETQVRVLTWNVWLMPWWTFQSPKNERRAEAIASALLGLDYDILCLEKVFDRRGRRVLLDKLKGEYPHQYVPANPGSSLRINSGVVVLSRTPLSDYREIRFERCSGVDCFSRKGAIFLRVEQGVPAPFAIIATHLQGSGHHNKRRQAVRDLQLAQIERQLVRPHAAEDEPLVLAGDLSTPRFELDQPGIETRSYRQLLQTFRATNGTPYRVTLDDYRARNDLAIDDSGRTDELDYVLLRPAGARVQDVRWTRHILRDAGWDGPKQRRDLSYRYAVGLTITFTFDTGQNDPREDP